MGIVAVLNFSGNVGKSTLVSHVLKPRMPNATVLAIESINHGADGVQLRGENFDALQDHILEGGDIILDVGASNIESFLLGVERYHGTADDIDTYVVPVVPETKQMIDTISTIKALSSLGINADRIRIVFNRLPRRHTPRDDFAALYGFYKQYGGFQINDGAYMEETEIFDYLKATNRNLADIAIDAADYKAQLANTENVEERENLKMLIKAQRLAIPMRKNLDCIFEFCI